MYGVYRTILPALAATVLSGCAGNIFKGLGGAERQESRATVYIYRQPGGIQGAYPKTVFVDGKSIGLLVANGYFKIYLEPGAHLISTPAANKAELRLRVAGNVDYYVSQEVIPAHPPFILINRVKESIGKPYVAHGHRLY